MVPRDDEKGKLKHELANARQQKRALQSMLERASDEIEELIEKDCDETGKARAVEAARRFRRASSL